MTSYCDGVFLKYLILIVLLCQVLSLAKPFKDDNSVVKEIFSESKREVSPSAGPAVVPLFKSSLLNPYLFFPTVLPEKPSLYPQLNPNEPKLSRLGESPLAAAPPFDLSDPSTISTYFKTKKDEFLMKLLERITNSPMATSETKPRSAMMGNETTLDVPLPFTDPSFFLKKKSKFLETLFKMLSEPNATSPAMAANKTQSDDEMKTSTTPSTQKPTIVPPDFWFPFPKVAKTPKPPKPTKPPKAKKVLKDALDTILLQSLLIDLGMDPQQTAITKRGVVGSTPAKSSKSKKLKPDDSFSKLYDSPQKVNPKVDPSTPLIIDCVDKLLKILNKTENENAKNCLTPKETDYDSDFHEFLDYLLKIFDETKSNPYPLKSESSKKLKGATKKKSTRSTFLDELLHRITTTPEPTTTIAESSISMEEITDADFDCTLIKEFVSECICENKSPKPTGEDASVKTQRSLIFRPFGLGYWIPQYIYAAKMGMYLDKLMDSINSAATTDVESVGESANVLKRNVVATPPEDITGLSSKEAALKLIISELSELKNFLIDAFIEGIKAQKDALPTQKPYGPSGKSFKKSFWAGKAIPTTDPIAPIQKRIDVLNEVFDKLTTVEKTLIFTSESEYDPKLLANLTEILQLTSPKSKTSQLKSSFPKSTENPKTPSYLLAKLKEYLSSNEVDSSDYK